HIPQRDARGAARGGLAGVQLAHSSRGARDEHGRPLQHGGVDAGHVSSSPAADRCGTTRMPVVLRGRRATLHHSDTCHRSRCAHQGGYVLIALWIINGLLAAAFLFGGAMKALSPKEKLAEKVG